MVPRQRCRRGKGGVLQIDFLALQFWTHAESFSPGSRGDTSCYTSSDTKWTQGEGGPPVTHVVHGDRSFDRHDADFVLFGVTAEEIRWLQSRVVVPHATVRPLRRDANVVHGLAVVVLRLCRLCARRPVGPHGHLPSLGSCARRVGDVPRGTTCVAPGQLDVDGPSSSSARAPASTASFSLKIERRFMRWVAHRVRPRESWCPVHKKQVLPVLVVGAPPRKKRSQEQHALNGNSRLWPPGLLLTASDSELTSPTTRRAGCCRGPTSKLLTRPEVDILEV